MSLLEILTSAPFSALNNQLLGKIQLELLIISPNRPLSDFFGINSSVRRWSDKLLITHEKVGMFRVLHLAVKDRYDFTRVQRTLMYQDTLELRSKPTCPGRLRRLTIQDCRAQPNNRSEEGGLNQTRAQQAANRASELMMSDASETKKKWKRKY